MLKVTPDGLAITKRFFEAMDILKANGKIRGLQTFTKSHGISYGHMNVIKNNMETHGIKPEFIAYLAKDFGVSTEWILLGRGNMFMENSSNG